MRSMTPSLDGSHIPRPEGVRVYANKPLPPLPLSPPGVNGKIIRRKPSYGTGMIMAGPMPVELPAELPVELPASLPASLPSRRSARSMSTQMPPTSSPAKSQHIRNGSYSGPPATGHRSSKKVKQLMGHNVDVSDDASATWTRRPSSRISTRSSSCHSQQDLSSSYHSEYTFGRSVEDNALPPLDTDLDGYSSRDSALEPPSPHPGMLVPLSIDIESFRRASRRSDSSGSPQSSIDMDMPKRWDPAYGQFSDSDTADEYHKIASELATQEELNKGVATVSKKPTLSFKTFRDVSTGRLFHIQERSEPTIPEAQRPVKSLNTVAEEKANLQSAFDLDSDDEDGGNPSAGGFIRASWRRDTGAAGEWASANGARGKKSDQMKDFLASRARMLQARKVKV